VPRVVDKVGENDEVAELRARACAGLSGQVLEIGFGSGLNVRFYPATVRSVAAVEPSDVGWSLSAPRRERTDVPIERRGLDGQRLDEPDASYDCVLSTLTLCTIPDAARALREVRRVLKPGGTLHFLEHGLAPDPRVATWQRRLDPLQKRVFAGCHLSRDVPALVAGSGLVLGEVEARYLTGPPPSRPWSYGYLGTATRAA